MSKQSRQYASRKGINKICLCAIIVWTLMISIAAYANEETLSTSVVDLVVTTNNTSVWSGSGNAYAGSAATTSGGDSCNPTYTQTEGSITFKNNKSVAAILEFSYTVTNLGTATVDGTAVTAGGTFTKELAAGASITVYLQSVSGAEGTSVISITGVSLEVENSIDVTFAPVTGVEYKVGDTLVSESTGALTLSGPNTNTYKITVVTANRYFTSAPWSAVGTDGVTTKGTLIPDGSSAIGPKVSCTVTPFFAVDADADGVAPFTVDGNPYWTWESAFSAGVASTVILSDDYDLPSSLAGNGLGVSGAYVKEIDGTITYQIPTTAKFLIPFGSGDTGSFTSEPTNYISESNSCTMYDNGGMVARNFAHATLKVPAGAKIDCYGQINVNGQRQNDGQPYSGVTLGGYGKIALNGATDEEQLVIQSGAKLYCYGYITGAGMVNVKSGGAIHELIQVCDWPGGSNASNWNDAAVTNASLFPLSQYYVQNVESVLRLEAGASAYVEAVLTASGSSQTISSAYVGTSSGLFQMKTGAYAIRRYDAANDRMNYHVYGEIDIGYLEIKKTFLGMEIINLNSSNYVLPLGNNMSVAIESGGVLNVGKQIALMPGSELIVAEGGTVNLSGQIYIVDVKDWSRTYFFNRASMTDKDDTSKTVYANTSADFAPVPYVATLDGISPRTTELVRGCTVDPDDGSIAQRYYMKAVDCTASGKLVVNGTMNVSGTIAVTSGSSTNKAVTGTGTINFTSAPTAGTMKGGYSSTIRDFTTTIGVANMAGISSLKSFATGTYYGQSNGYWYNWVVTADDVANFTVTAGTTGLSDSTVTRYNSSTKQAETISNVVGLVSYYWNGSASVQSTFTFTMAAADGTGLSVNGGGNVKVTPTLDVDTSVLTYGMVSVTADVTLGISTANPTTVTVVAPNANNAPFYSMGITFPSCTDLCNFFSDAACTTAATSAKLGDTVYISGGDAVAAIAVEIKPEEGDPSRGDYVQAFMKVSEAVAEAIGENTYVVVLQDRTLTDAIVVGEDQNITLDLGGKTLNGGTKSFEPLTNNGTLRLINGTISYSASKGATVRNNGTIEYIERVTIEQMYYKSSGNTSAYAIYNTASAEITEIRSGTIQTADQKNGYPIYTLGKIGTIGTSGNTVTLYGRRAIEMAGSAEITTIGGAGSTVNITGGQRGIDLTTSTNKVTTIGEAGCTINFYSGEYQMHKSGIYCAGTITTVGGQDSTLNFNLTPLDSHYMESYGINVTSNGNITTLGAAGSTINIIGVSAQTAIHTGDAKYKNHMYGIYNKGTITNIGSKATKDYPASVLNIDVSHSGVNGNVTGIHNAKTITNFGADGATICIKSTYTGTDTATHGYGIYNSGTITNLGLSTADIDVVCNEYGISNTGTISAMEGVTGISTDSTGSYYALYNTGTISMINSGDFYHASGRDRAVYNPDDQNYPAGYKLSTTTRTVTVPVWDAETSTYVDNELTYDCYFVAMKFYASNVYLGNNLDMMFAFPQDLVAKWDDYYVIAVRTYADGTTEQITFSFNNNEWGSITIGEGENAKPYYTILYTGFAAKEMCDTITLTIYDGNGQKVSVECVDSIQKYAMRMLNQYANHETLRTMLVDMLNYGAACQTHFSYNNSEENLANAKLDETQQGYATKTVEWSQTLYNPENDFFDGSNLITTSNIQFAVAFTNSADPTSFSYQFTNHWGNGVGNGFAYNEKDAYYYIDTLVVADARKPITITDGTQAGTWTDSIESYCYRMIHKEGVTDVQANVFTAFMIFSDSANAYLHNRGGVE